MKEQDSAMRMMLMTALHDMGVTPDEYADFTAHFNEIKALAQQIKGSRSRKGFTLMTPGSDGTLEQATVKPIDDAASKTLVLKVQMKGVTKPPMWRELLVPADFNFTQLHYAIQAATGLMNSHLWQFQYTAYNPDLQIGVPNTSTKSGFGLDEWTHESDTTPLTGFLAKKGDMLEYVYDFGDDWIFTVTVTDIIDRQGEVAKCRKWKSALQPLEDTGGIRHYIKIRDIYESWSGMKKKERRQAAEHMGYDDPEDLYAELDDSLIDIDYINEQLAEIPSAWQDFDDDYDIFNSIFDTDPDE